MLPYQNPYRAQEWAVSNLRIMRYQAEAVGNLGAAPQRAYPRGRSLILHSWKQIASYIGLGVRTVQRYEIQFCLPVHRVGGKNPGAVLALADEIDAWLRSTPVAAKAIEQRGIREIAQQRSNQSCVGLQFRRATNRMAKTKSITISSELQTPT